MVTWPVKYDALSSHVSHIPVSPRVFYISVHVDYGTEEYLHGHLSERQAFRVAFPVTNVTRLATGTIRLTTSSWSLYPRPGDGIH